MTIRRRFQLLLAAALCMRIAHPAEAAGLVTWPDDRFHRVAALALLDELRVALLTEASATLTLEHWCRAHRIADDATLRADRDPDRTLPITPGQRALLGIGPDETVGYRHVRLSCGDRTLSEADNWYVPSRLTPRMNSTLATTHVPFGKAVAALGFTRTTLSSRLLWSPLPVDWAETPASAKTAAKLAIPESLIENQALLRDRSGRPFSLLIETYTSGVLGFTPPSP